MVVEVGFAVLVVGLGFIVFAIVLWVRFMVVVECCCGGGDGRLMVVVANVSSQ